MAWLNVTNPSSPYSITKIMDKRNRLTRWDEWEVGKTYVRVFGKCTSKAVTCIQVNKQEGFVLLQTTPNGCGVQLNGRTWENRYRRQYQAI